MRRRARGRRGLAQLAEALAEALSLVPTARSEAAPTASGSTPLGQSGAPSEGSAASAAGPSAARADAAAASSSSPPVRATFLVGGGVRTRAFELLSPDGLDAGYRAEPYFELVARGSARFFDVAFVRAAFGSSIALDSAREEARLGTLETWFAHALADVGASVLLDGVVELGAAFGVSWERYQIAFNELVPTAEYVSLRPALLTGFRLVGEALVLTAEIGVRVPLGVGDLEAIHGVEHEALGLDGTAALGGVIAPGFTWSLEVGARHVWLTFERPDGRVTGFDAGWHATALAGWQL